MTIRKALSKTVPGLDKLKLSYSRLKDFSFKIGSCVEYAYKKDWNGVYMILDEAKEILRKMLDDEMITKDTYSEMIDKIDSAFKRALAERNPYLVESADYEIYLKMSILIEDLAKFSRAPKAVSLRRTVKR